LSFSGSQNKDNTTIRGCTDPLFFFVMIFAIGGSAYVTNWGAENGNVERIMYGVDSWDNICGYDNTVRLTQDDADGNPTNCTEFESSSDCKGTQGCKWIPEITNDEDVTIAEHCASEMINSQNAGLNLINRKSQYFTDPNSPSAMVICVDHCPTEATFTEAGLTVGLLDSDVDCDPDTAFCRDFCLVNTADTPSLTPNPYGLYEAGPKNDYMTNNQDRGNCFDGDDAGAEACSLTPIPLAGSGDTSANDARDEIEAQFESFIMFGVEILNDAKNAALEAAGVGTFDDWDTPFQSDETWKDCKAAAEKDLASTANTDSCPNTGCPKKVYATYDLPAFVRNVYHPCINLPFGSSSATLITGAAEQALEELYQTSIIKDAMTAVASTYVIIGYCMGIAVVLSYLMVFGMKFVIRPLICILMVVALLLIIILMFGLWGFYYSYRDAYDALEDPALAPDSLTRNKDNFHIAAQIWTVFTIIMFLLLVSLRKKIWIAATLYMEASKALFATPTMLLSPIFDWTWNISLIFVWCWTAVLIATSGFTVIQPNEYSGQGHAFAQDLPEYQNFLWFHIFMLLWGLAFLAACHEFVLAGCITNWYKWQGATDDAGEKLTAPNMALFRSMGRLARYHLGTVALGSLIIAVVQAIQMILNYIKKKSEQSGTDDGVMKFVIKACICCMWLLEKCLKYINRNAWCSLSCSIVFWGVGGVHKRLVVVL
jgi:hypothetical protein